MSLLVVIGSSIGILVVLAEYFGIFNPPIPTPAPATTAPTTTTITEPPTITSTPLKTEIFWVSLPDPLYSVRSGDVILIGGKGLTSSLEVFLRSEVGSEYELNTSLEDLDPEVQGDQLVLKIYVGFTPPGRYELVVLDGTAKLELPGEGGVLFVEVVATTPTLDPPNPSSPTPAATNGASPTPAPPIGLTSTFAPPNPVNTPTAASPTGAIPTLAPPNPPTPTLASP